MRGTVVESFENAFAIVPIGQRKIKEREYLLYGDLPVVDQGKNLVSGYTNQLDLAISGCPLIAFGDHTRAIKYVDFPFVAGADGLRLYSAKNGYLSKFLYYFLRAQKLPIDGYGRHSKYLYDLQVPKVSEQQQAVIVSHIECALAEVETARAAVTAQLRDVKALTDAIIFDTTHNVASPSFLGYGLDEVKKGIGADWASYPVLGATRDGLAPAKEPPGKHGRKYKHATAGTVFYNPMRILIGSIAFVDEDDTAGITSPDYVVLRGKPGIVDSRWFYHWLRSPLGAQCILSLARGAVRERMLFNRLAEGKISLPDYPTQQRASAALCELKPLKRALQTRLAEINLLPQKILSAAFEM